MGSIWKVILGVFVCVMIAFTGFGVICANNEAAFAECYLHEVSSALSASGFSQEVHKYEIQETKKLGYELSIEYVYNPKAQNPKIEYAIVGLVYPYDVSILNLHTRHRKQMVVY